MYIDTIIVDKDYRNKGIGKALMENAINFAINNNCEIVELTSKLNNENAHRFYEGIGFKKHSYKFKKYL
jgi:ribosomal protein S18 acetylase RimI-like enzyme